MYISIWILIGIAKQCIMTKNDTSISDTEIDKMLISALKGPFS
jgi:hypothetical protein